jgi:hypothetical protein
MYLECIVYTRFLGWSASHISGATKFGEKTVLTHVYGVAKAIRERMANFIRVPSSPEEWLSIAKDFERRTCLPNCLGAVGRFLSCVYSYKVVLDGKLIYLRKPDKAGTQWYSYKQRNATILMAVVDSKYRFIHADIGAFGSNNDAYTFNSGAFCKAMEANRLNIPECSRLPNSQKSFPYYIVGDDAFALRRWLIKPFNRANQELSDAEHEFNYRYDLSDRISNISYKNPESDLEGGERNF